MTAVQSALKEMYVGQNLVELGYKNRPFFAMVEKNTELDGNGFPLPIRYSNGATSALFANALANIAAPGVTRFLLTSVARYSLGQLDRKTMMASAKSTSSFLKAVEIAVNGAVESVSEALSADCFGDGTGQRSTIGTISTGVITLASPGDIVGFPLNQKINAISGTVRGAAGWVIARNAQTGQITVGTSLGGVAATPAGWTAGDGLCLDGDFNAVLSGLKAWLPGSVTGGLGPAPPSGSPMIRPRPILCSTRPGAEVNVLAWTTQPITLASGMAAAMRPPGSMLCSGAAPSAGAPAPNHQGTPFIAGSTSVCGPSSGAMRCATSPSDGLLTAITTRSCTPSVAASSLACTGALSSAPPWRSRKPCSRSALSVAPRATALSLHSPVRPSLVPMKPPMAPTP